MNILEITTNLRLRLDYFSMPGIRERIVDAIYKIGHMGIPEKRLMTTFDQELMDIDSISSVSSHSGFAFKFWNSHKS